MESLNVQIILKSFPQNKQKRIKVGTRLLLYQNHQSIMNSIINELMSDPDVTATNAAAPEAVPSEQKTPQEAPAAPETAITEPTPEAATADPILAAEPAATETPAEHQQHNAEAPQETVPAPKPKSFASEKVAKYNAFVEKTGKDDWKDFEFLTTPSKELDAKELIRKYYSEQEGMSEQEIAFAMSELEVAPSDEDDDFVSEADEKEKLRAEAKLASELRKASKWHDANLESFESESGPYESSTDDRYTYSEFIENAQKQQADLVTHNRSQVYQELPKLTSVELSYPGNKDLGIDPVNVNYTPNEDYIKHARAVSEDVGVLINSFFNDKNELINPKGFIETVTKAYAPTSQAMTDYLIEQAILNDRVKRNKQQRNVSADVYRSAGHNTGGDNGHEVDDWLSAKHKTSF